MKHPLTRPATHRCSVWIPRILALLLIPLCLHSPATAQTDGTSKDSVRRIIAKPKVPTFTWNEGSLFKAYGLEKSKRFPKTGMDVIKLAYTPVSVKATIEAMMATGNYEWVEEDFAMEPFGFSTTDPFFSRQWHLQHINSTFNIPLGGDVNVIEAWQQSKGSSDVVVVVLDTGVDYRHPDLHANMWKNEGEIPGNGIDDDRNGYIDDVYGIDTGDGDSDPMDAERHGTHVAGIIGAKGNNKTGVSGILWNTRIMALKGSVWNPSSGREVFFNSNVIECLEYIHHMKTVSNVNIKVVNCSFGGARRSVAFFEAIKALEAVDILVVCAAGNGGSDSIGDDNNLNPMYPSAYETTNVVAVANTTSSGALNSSSNFGSWRVNIAAPGTNILSTIPGGRYAFLSGTSMAAPIVSGAAALLWSIDPGLSVNEVKKALIDGATRSKELKGRVAANGKLDIAASIQRSKKPFLTGPLPNTRLQNDEAWFAWNANGQSVDAWLLRVGSQPGLRDLHDSGILNNDVEAVLVRNLPNNGSELFVTLYWFADGSWKSRTYDSIQTRNLDPQLWSPVVGTVFEGSTVVFSWIDNDQPVTGWTLNVGNEMFGSDIHVSNRLSREIEAIWIDHMPTDGRTVWVTLGWELHGAWNFQSYEFTTAFVPEG